MKALIVDDDDITLDLLTTVLEDAGHEVTVAHDGVEALEKLRTAGTSLLITDWEMPNMNGLELCRAVRSDEFAGYVYVIMLTSRDGTQSKIDGLLAGADNFVTKPLNPDELLVCLKTAERIVSLETRDLAMFAMAKLAESRDPDTGLHIERVQAYARLLAQHLSTLPKYNGIIDGEFVTLIYQTAPLHDIGKVGIPDSVLLKPGKLTAEEYAVMQTHTRIGNQTLDAALRRFPGVRFLEMARDIASSHHEKFDGSGYPEGLRGRQIPLAARIVALADVYDALTSPRVYKPPIPHERARQIIQAESGAHFDPDIVEAFIKNEHHFAAIKDRLADKEATAQKPIEVAPTPAQVKSQRHASEILVVEDEPSQRESLVSELSQQGYSVLSAASGEEAIDMVLIERPRMIISDLLMPGIDGVELCRRVRDIRGLPYVHFTIVSVQDDSERAVEALDGGVDDFVLKPYNVAELMARVRAGWRTLNLHDELARKNAGTKELNVVLSSMNNHLEQIAVTDDLTGLFNRRHAVGRLEEQWALADRYGKPLTVAMIDIDHFKLINDNYGHAAGDQILSQLARLLVASARTSDTVCRLGGEEFLIIFPNQTVQEAVVCADRIRARVAETEFRVGSESIVVTISIGVSSRRAEMVECSELIASADEALYQAKRQGRNRVNVGRTRAAIEPPPNRQAS